MMAFNHYPVMLQETINSLNVNPGGIYVDCTTGGGSHSAKILEKLSPEGRLICFDVDPNAIAHIKERFHGKENVIIVHDNFKNIKTVLAGLGYSSVDGIIADLGVSSVELDNPERGFTYNDSDAPLDMRMSCEGTTAADILNSADERTLSDIIFRYSEEKMAKVIARNIVAARSKRPYETAGQLVETIRASLPAKVIREGGFYPAVRRVFQALRIEVNGELSNLPDAIDDMFDVLGKDGVLSIIGFHSIEDRIVKKHFANFCTGCTCPPSFPICVCGKTPRGKLNFKSLTPSEEELAENSRSHSARLRSITKL